MRPFRVFNRVSKVPVMWKVGGVRLGGVGQAAMLLAMTAGVLLVLSGSILAAAVVFVTAALFIILVSGLLRRLDPDETVSDITAFTVLAGGLRHRHTANYDAWND
jgi:hypothetical protein